METKLFHFYRIFNSGKGGGEPTDPPPNRLLRTEKCWPLQVIQLSKYLFEGYLPGKFAHLNVFSIRSFDCMVLCSFHTPSLYDFRSNVIHPYITEGNVQNMKLMQFNSGFIFCTFCMIVTAR